MRVHLDTPHRILEMALVFLVTFRCISFSSTFHSRFIKYSGICDNALLYVNIEVLY